MREKGKHLDQSTRDRIKGLLNDGRKVTEIGRILNIHHSTISREIKRNSYGSDGRTPKDKKKTYDPTTAEHKAYARRKYSKYQGKKINENRNLQDHIIAKLTKHWSPDEISGHLKLHRDCRLDYCHEPGKGSGCSTGMTYAKVPFYATPCLN